LTVSTGSSPKQAAGRLDHRPVGQRIEDALGQRARDVALEQLRIECFYPADYATEVLAGRLAGASP
jgi:hypothetical protein